MICDDCDIIWQKFENDGRITIVYREYLKCIHPLNGHGGSLHDDVNFPSIYYISFHGNIISKYIWNIKD